MESLRLKGNLIKADVPEQGPQAIELVDNMEVNNDFKKTVLIPYLEQVYECLIIRTKTRFYGVPSYAFCEVFL